MGSKDTKQNNNMKVQIMYKVGYYSSQLNYTFLHDTLNASLHKLSTYLRYPVSLQLANKLKYEHKCVDIQR